MAIWSRRFLAVPALAVLSVAAACAGEQDAATAEAASVPAAAPAAEVGSTAPAGRVIEVRMIMSGSTASFEPAEITAKPGDVVRFVNVDNVHNVSFPQDKNAGASNLPAASPYLTAPGQTYDLVVELQPGTYTFQCDPHVPMGMVGSLTVVQ